MPAGRSVVVVERGPVAAFADAILDPSPIYRDPDVAGAAGWEAIPVPPTFPIAMPHWGSFMELQPDGDELRTPRALLAGIAGEGGVLLHGEQEFEYHRPVWRETCWRATPGSSTPIARSPKARR
jgi:hypothetical protein